MGQLMPNALFKRFDLWPVLYLNVLISIFQDLHFPFPFSTKIKDDPKMDFRVLSNAQRRPENAF